MAHIILFEHANFHGAHKHLFQTENNLNAGDDNWFNDKVSSFVILEGHWQFFRDSNFNGPASNILGPGKYNWIEAFGIPNDSISSLKTF
jgi:hypothetical protein